MSAILFKSIHAQKLTICYSGASNGARAKTYTSYGLNDLLPLKFGPMDLMSDDKAFPLLLAQQHHQVKNGSGAKK
jgi:hypothetical protein